MRPAARVLRRTPLILALALLPACERGTPSAPADLELKHFEGVIDNSRQTYDAVQSSLYVRGSRALEAGDARTAEEAYREVIAKYPDDPVGHEALGTCLSFQGKYEESDAEYRRALQLNPKSVDALYGLGCVRYWQRQFAESKDYLQEALALNEKNAECHRVLGIVCDEIGEKPAAALHYERAVELSPRYANDEYIKTRLRSLKR